VLPSNPSDIPSAVAAAREADVVVLYIGGKAGWYSDDLTEGEGKDTANIDLPPQQVELVNAVADLGKPTVAVVSFGRPQGLAPVIDRLPALLTAYYGGPHQGVALADALFGVTNPGGKLPVTLPRHVGQGRSITVSGGAAGTGEPKPTFTRAISTCPRRRSSHSATASATQRSSMGLWSYGCLRAAIADHLCRQELTFWPAHPMAASTSTISRTSSTNSSSIRA